MIFRDRVDAGRKLARALEALRLERPVVLGIPRGGVPVAAEVARALGGELGVIVARKIGAPGRPELAIGATTASGATVVDRRAAAHTGADEAYLAAATEEQVREARRREALFQRRPLDLAGRSVVIVDDGLATGATALAAVRAARRAGAARLVLAVPVAAPDALERLAREVDHATCLLADADFRCVGAYYDDFTQVSDHQVQAILGAAPV